MAKFFTFLFAVGLLTASIVVVDRRSASIAPPQRPRASAPEMGVYASGIVEGSTEEVALRPEAAGRVVEVRATLGAWAEPGDVLVRLDDQRQRQELAAASAQLQLAAAQLEKLQSGATPEERSEARSLLAARKAEWEQAKLTLGRFQTLRQHDAIAQQQADEQASRVRVLAAETAAAEARVAQLEAPPRAHELNAAEARVAAAQAQVELAQLALEKSVLRARTRGQILAVNVELGELLDPQNEEPAVAMADTSVLRVRAYVEESDAPGVTTGTTATITADGLGTQSFSANVQSVSPRMTAKVVNAGQADELYDTKVREILLEVDPAAAEAGLIPGLRVDVQLAERPSQLYLK